MLAFAFLDNLISKACFCNCVEQNPKCDRVHNSRTNKDNLITIEHKVDHIDGIADKKYLGAGYTSSRSIGKILNFLIFFSEHILSL